MPLSANGRSFGTLAEVMAKANEPKAGDELAGLAASDAAERTAAKTVLAELPLSRFVEEPLLPPEDDEGVQPPDPRPTAVIDLGPTPAWDAVSMGQSDDPARAN